MCQPSVSSWSSWPCGGDEWQDLGRNGIAQVAVGLLIVIVLRALGELLHIDVCGATGFTSPSKLYATGAMAAAAAALVAFALHAMGRDHSPSG
jgi:hypothetical protein